MSVDIAIVLAVLVVAVVLFATEKVRVDLVALLVMAVLLATRVVTAEEGIRGFANPATVTVAAMFVLSAGLTGTGAMNALGGALAALRGRRPGVALLAMMIGIGAVSAFINNTAAVAIFLPVILALARETGTSPSKLLIPLSYASIFGGTCTLIGTSTNILTSSIAEAHGLRPFGMFEFTALGLVFFAVGTLYMATLGVRLLPARVSGGDLAGEFEISDYLTEIVILPEAASVGKRLGESPLVRQVEMAVLEIRRGEERISLPKVEFVLQAGDVLWVRCAADGIRQLQQREGIAIRPHAPWRAEDLRTAGAVLVEAILAPNSDYSGKTLRDARFRQSFGGAVLAIRHQGQLLREKLSNTPLRAGDVLLIEVGREELPRFRKDRNFVLVSEVRQPRIRKRKALPALAIIAAVVAAATVGLLPIVSAAIVGCALLVVTRCVTLEEAYRAIDWKVVFLLAGVLTLGTALETTGAARLISQGMVSTLRAWGPGAVVSAFYLLTSLLTEMMSNNATAVLLAPIAIAAAETLGCDSRPFLMAVTFAASASFMTPVGYQTNTLVYGPGGYRFADFLRVGTPLNILFWILATVLIPRFWPF